MVMEEEEMGAENRWKSYGGRRKMSTLNLSDKIFVFANHMFLIFVFLMTLYPLLFVLSASVSEPASVTKGEMLLFPVGFTMEGYRHLLKYKDIWSGYGNAFFYTITGTFLNLLVTIPAAYALSRKDLRYRGMILGLFVFTMYFSGGLIPTYLNMKSFGLLDKRTAILILGLVSPYNLIVARTFFGNTIPWELQEAARIDGASNLTIFLRIVLPLSKPIMAVMVLYYGVSHWNSYFTEMIYLRDRSKWPLQLFLREILAQGQMAAASIEGADAQSVQALMQQQDTANLLKYAVMVAAILPMMVLYPFLQKFFAKGVMIGSIKG